MPQGLRRSGSAVALIVGLVVTGLSSTTGHATELDDPRVASAMRFRQVLGLANDPSRVRASLLDSTTYPNTDWGLPLTQSEAAEIERRANAQEALGPATTAAWSMRGLRGCSH